MSEYQVALPVFEGPLDLLLHLVKKHELDVFDIPVAFITKKYVEHLELMRSLNLEIAGEYLLMAATLAHLKSRELLPPDPSQIEETDDGEEIDTRQELIRRLLEYQKYKAAGGQLSERPVLGRNVWTRGSDTDDVVTEDVAQEAPLEEIPLFSLVEALAEVLAKAKLKISHEVTVERLSISDRMNQLVDRLLAEGTFSFTSCFKLEADSPEALKYHVVVTFMAVLELTRLKLIRIAQPEDDANILITRAVADEQTLRDRIAQEPTL